MRDYTDLLNLLTDSGNLSKACRELGIAKSTFLDAVDSDEILADQYARARARGFDAEAERALEEALIAEDAGLGRLSLDARKWYLSKLAAKKYGDKLELEHAGNVTVNSVRRQIIDPKAGDA